MSEKLIIEGGIPLVGEVDISGAKNAALPCLAASILIPGKCKLKNIPRLKDIDTILQLLEELGISHTWQDDKTLLIDVRNINNFRASYKLVSKMRASILVMGALLGRLNKAEISMPGGCAIGLRPIDLHLKGLSLLGAQINTHQGYIYLKADKLIGRDIYLDFPSVGATENLMMAASRAEGKTCIYGAAKEPEIINLAEFLKKMGAEIEGEGTDKLQIIGCKKDNIGELKDNRGELIEHEIIPDRIEAGTYMIAAAITKGRIRIKNVNPSHLEGIITKLKEAGIEVEVLNSNSLCVSIADKLFPVNIKTMPYPGFPTDMQAQFTSLMTKANGISVITEMIFEKRFAHIPELIRMGANIKVNTKMAIVKGCSRLIGTSVSASDLRASAALILAGLAAEGRTTIHNIHHLDRGYEKLEEKLINLKGNIRRE